MNYYGKYRGVVVDNQDPEGLGRIQARVPDIHGTSGQSPWCLPCVPVAGIKMGIFVLPPKGANVWIEYEGGDLDYPIWTGGYWANSSMMPRGADSAGLLDTMVVSTTLGSTLTLSDQPGPAGGIKMTTRGGAKIEINDLGITIDNGQGASITLRGATVSINKAALTVT